ncbi:MAG: c-type cytochrome [Deltaproteobacteria bacterium]|nr:c-type cytochrome [Deltaproteobacteria bacterium]
MRPYEEPLLQMEREVVAFQQSEALLRATPDNKLLSPVDLRNPQVIAAGKNLYFTFCAQCHGKQYDGNGTVGQSFQPLPSDLRSVKVQALSPGRQFKEISYGVPRGRQPRLATTIAVPDRWKIVAFVRSLGPRH